MVESVESTSESQSVPLTEPTVSAELSGESVSPARRLRLLEVAPSARVSDSSSATGAVSSTAVTVRLILAVLERSPALSTA